MEGQPWCAGCTAQLSDDDPHSIGLRDPANPTIRYRLRNDQNHAPTHSNLHNDLIRIHRTNADYHRSQRDTEELQQATHGTLPDYRPLTTYINTPSAANISSTIDRYQYDRYQRRGGRLPQGDHRLDFTYNSPNITNMNPENLYRQWFHSTISRSHYSLGEATDHYNQWISDPDYGPNPLSYNPATDHPPHLSQLQPSPPPPTSPDYQPESPRHPNPRRHTPPQTIRITSTIFAKRPAHKHSCRTSIPPPTTPTQSLTVVP